MKMMMKTTTNRFTQMLRKRIHGRASDYEDDDDYYA